MAATIGIAAQHAGCRPHALVSNAGTWTSVTTTPVPAAWLQAGGNTIAVRITQDNNTNTWSVNPTMFQAELTIPTQSP
jgi:hypothetical protein